MNEFMLSDKNAEQDLTFDEVAKDITDTKLEDVKTANNQSPTIEKSYDQELSINNELEELKKVHLTEITQIKLQQQADRESYEKDKENWFAQRTELEVEIYNLKNTQEKKPTEPERISYDVQNI